MLRRILIAAAALLLVAVGVLYILGRGRLEDRPVQRVWQDRLGEDVRLETVRLYFGDPERFALRAEDRTIVAGPDVTEKIGACVQELATGSLTGGFPVVPPDTRLVKAYVDPWGLAFLDFNRALLGKRPPGDGEEWLAVASLVRTVCDNFAEVREVRFMVEGQVVTSLAGYMDLEEALRAEDFPMTPAAH